MKNIDIDQIDVTSMRAKITFLVDKKTELVLEIDEIEGQLYDIRNLLELIDF